ncbi:EamA family transporter [Streptomyces stelliscabiei]|uniref:EamA family transporter n=1 Tax=Streptomyces stelliscabiei TaxID=146820 RepID=UPI002FEF8A3D
MQSSSALPVRQGVLYVAIAATAWGTGGAVAAELYDVAGIGPISVSFWRFLTGLGLLLTAHLVRRTRRLETALSLRATYAANPRRALLIGFGLAVYQTAYFASCNRPD